MIDDYRPVVKSSSKAEVFRRSGVLKRAGWKEIMRDESDHWITIVLVKDQLRIMVTWKQ